VGHTHEDIDALFGKIWEFIKEEMALTPQAYETLITKALSKPNRPVKVVDIFVVPDYKSLLDEFVCDNLSNYMKEEEETQLQFIFESVHVSEDYPFGVKVQYRVYCAEDIIEIWEGEGENFPNGFQPVQVEVKSYPVDVIKALPTEECRIHPQPFVAGSRDELEKVANQMISECENMNIVATQEWKEFLEIYPHNDNVMSYLVQTGPLELPLFDEIFKGVPFTPLIVQPGDKRKAWEAKQLRRYQTEPSLGHERGTVPTRSPTDGLPSQLPQNKKTQKNNKRRIEEASPSSEETAPTSSQTPSLRDIRSRNILRNQQQLQQISESLGMSELLPSSIQLKGKQASKGPPRSKKLYEKRPTSSRASKTVAVAKITECTNTEKDNHGKSIQKYTMIFVRIFIQLSIFYSC